jgi:phospholipase/lecithinase/hemolysin
MRHYRTLTLAVLIPTILVSSLHAELFSEIVVFGDSESDAGNVFELSGDTYPASPPYWQGRFSNGPVWVAAAI